MRKGGGIVLNALKGGETEIRGGETKILKRGDKLCQRVGALKSVGGGGLEPPYELCLVFILFIYWMNLYL